MSREARTYIARCNVEILLNKSVFHRDVFIAIKAILMSPISSLSSESLGWFTEYVDDRWRKFILTFGAVNREGSFNDTLRTKTDAKLTVQQKRSCSSVKQLPIKMIGKFFFVWWIPLKRALANSRWTILTVLSDIVFLYYNMVNSLIYCRDF